MMDLIMLVASEGAAGGMACWMAHTGAFWNGPLERALQRGCLERAIWNRLLEGGHYTKDS